MSDELTADHIATLRKNFSAEPANQLMQNALTRASVDDVALDRQLVVTTDTSVSHRLDDWIVTDQKKSGRCWLFAGLNLMRVDAARAMNLKDFEFSQNHLMFWDKLERSNYFLEAILETADRDIDDRTVAYLLDQVSNDGGQWSMFVALVRKHGVVPKSAMPETHSSSDTARLNEILQRVLRRGALAVRTAGGEVEQRECKNEILETVHRVLTLHLGTPPEQFHWQWTDKDRVFHRDGELTPQAFAEKYVTLPLEDYVCLVHDPRPSSPRTRTFTVEYLGNVVGAAPVVYLNVDLAVMKQAAMDTITGGEPVWFGCDVGKMKHNELGIWDARLYDLDAVYGSSLELDKASRLIAHDSVMTHAMLFTGVDVADGSPRKWRVENSWGAEMADQGFWTMNTSWFDEFVFEIAVRRDHLTAELQEAAHMEPIVLPAWDPMGALAEG